MKLRSIQEEDFDALLDLWNAAGLWNRGREAEWPRFQAVLKRNPHFCFLLEDGEQVLGCIFGLYNGRSMSVSRLSVHPDYQKRGLGRKLLEGLEHVAQDHGIGKIEASVHELNQEVLGFYEKQGFKLDPLTVLKKEL